MDPGGVCRRDHLQTGETHMNKKLKIIVSVEAVILLVLLLGVCIHLENKQSGSADIPTKHSQVTTIPENQATDTTEPSEFDALDTSSSETEGEETVITDPAESEVPTASEEPPEPEPTTTAPTDFKPGENETPGDFL